MCVEIEVLIGSLKRARRRGMLELSPRLPQTSRCNVAKIVSLRLTPSVRQVLVMAGWNIPPHLSTWTYTYKEYVSAVRRNISLYNSPNLGNIFS